MEKPYLQTLPIKHLRYKKRYKYRKKIGKYLQKDHMHFYAPLNKVKTELYNKNFFEIKGTKLHYQMYKNISIRKFFIVKRTFFGERNIIRNIFPMKIKPKRKYLIQEAFNSLQNKLGKNTNY